MILAPHAPVEIGLPGDLARRLAAQPGPIQRLRAVVLLSGTVRAGELQVAARRALLDLPVAAGRSLLDAWQAQIELLAQLTGKEHLSVRILVDRDAAAPRMRANGACVDFRAERDPEELRGTGGVLRDLAEDYQDDDFILVASAAQLLTDSLPALVTSLAQQDRDLAMVSHADGTPSSLMLVRCASLRAIPRIGFVDMKEQALPRIAAQSSVCVLRRSRPSGLPIRNRADYIAALRWQNQHGGQNGGQNSGQNGAAEPHEDPFAEDWFPAFAVVEEGGVVHPTAKVHDSVVLAGGRVEAGAVVVRSIVCPGAVVARDAVVVDRVVAAGSGR